MNKDAELLAFLLDGERDPKAREAIKARFANLTLVEKDEIENTAAFACYQLNAAMENLQNLIAKTLFV